MTKNEKEKIDDGFYPKLVRDASRVGYMGIPKLMDLHNTEVPASLIPFTHAEREFKRGNTHAYVHFYQFDYRFSQIITDIDKHIELLSHFDGAISPDCTMLDNQSNCLQAQTLISTRQLGFDCRKLAFPLYATFVGATKKVTTTVFWGFQETALLQLAPMGQAEVAEDKNLSEKAFLSCLRRLSRQMLLFTAQCQKQFLKTLDRVPPFITSTIGPLVLMRTKGKEGNNGPRCIRGRRL